MYLLKLLQKWIRTCKAILYIAAYLLLISCDFTSKIPKQIIRAQDLLQDLKYEEAAREYESILDRIPPSLLKNKIYFRLGEIYNLYSGDYKKAKYYFEKIVEDTSDPRWKVQAKDRLAKIYFDHREFSKAEKYYKQLYDFYPKLENQDFYQLGYGRSLLEQNRLTEAENIFKQMLEQNQHQFKAKAYYYLGLVKFSAKKWQQAANYWHSYLERETKKSDIVEAKFLLANAYETMEELQRAYDIYYSLLGDYPNAEVIKNRLESVYKRRIDRKR